jgi:hypothetical protein
MLDIPEEMQPFVNDYKMLLVEARQNNLTLHNMNNRDLFNLLEIILNKSGSVHETQQEAIDYATEHTVDKSVVMTVAGATKCKIDYNAFERKGDADMCTVFEETRKEGVIEGRAEGRAEAIEKMLRVDISEEVILSMGYTDEELASAKEKLSVQI